MYGKQYAYIRVDDRLTSGFLVVLLLFFGIWREVEAKAAAAEAQEQQARREREPRAKLPASPRATRTTRRSAFGRAEC